jgi:hypothetical protein
MLCASGGGGEGLAGREWNLTEPTKQYPPVALRASEIRRSFAPMPAHSRVAMIHSTRRAARRIIAVS